MTEIIPAILPVSYDELKEKLSLVAGHTPLVHIDICDGSLTETKSWPYRENAREWQHIQREEAGLPYWEEFNFEAHIMQKDVKQAAEEWIIAGAERLIVHYEAFESDNGVSDFLLTHHERFSGPNEHLKIELGLAVSFDTPVEKVFDHMLECDFIHLLSVSQLGAQGETFEEKIFDKIKALRDLYPETIIAVDGGVNLDNAARLVEAGVDRLVVGSSIWHSHNPLEALEDLIIEAE